MERRRRNKGEKEMSRILIIEDDMDLQEGLTYFLEKGRI